MSFLRSFGRPFVLLVLLVIGIGLIWHIGHNLYRPGSGVANDPAKTAVPAPEPQKPVSAAPLKFPDQAVRPPTVVPTGGPRIARTDRGRFIVTEPILFNSGASTLREASIPRLDRIGGFLIQHPQIKIEIIGHTDNLGPEPVNQKVSAERAEIVMNYLAAQGIDPSRLRSKGMGSLDPIESNDTQLGRQANRRIEFLITGDAGDQ